MRLVKTILVIDDEPRTRLGIKKTLEAWSNGRFMIEAATSGIEALEWLENNSVNIIITDICMPKIDGLQMLEALTEKGQAPVVIVISGYADFAYAKKALQLGVFEYLVKPIEKNVLIQAVERALVEESSRERIDVLEKLVDPKLVEINLEEANYNQLISDAMKYIDENMHDSITMKQVALHLHLNASYFSVLFKEETGVTFSEYLTRTRLQKAKELLLTTDMPIWEVAEKVGYSTDKYFIKVFKENEGISPKSFRKVGLKIEQTIQ